MDIRMAHLVSARRTTQFPEEINFASEEALQRKALREQPAAAKATNQVGRASGQTGGRTDEGTNERNACQTGRQIGSLTDCRHDGKRATRKIFKSKEELTSRLTEFNFHSFVHSLLLRA